MRDAVARSTPSAFSTFAKRCDLSQQLGVGERRAPRPARRSQKIGTLVAAAGLDVAVEAVVGHVQLAVGEPLVERRVAVVEDLGSARGTSRSPTARALPEGPEVRLRLVVDVGRGDPGAGRERRGGGNRRSSCSSASIASVIPGSFGSKTRPKRERLRGFWGTIGETACVAPCSHPRRGASPPPPSRLRPRRLRPARHGPARGVRGAGGASVRRRDHARQPAHARRLRKAGGAFAYPGDGSAVRVAGAPDVGRRPRRRLAGVGATTVTGGAVSLLGGLITAASLRVGGDRRRPTAAAPSGPRPCHRPPRRRRCHLGRDERRHRPARHRDLTIGETVEAIRSPGGSRDFTVALHLRLSRQAAGLPAGSEILVGYAEGGAAAPKPAPKPQVAGVSTTNFAGSSVPRCPSPRRPPRPATAAAATP